MGAHGNNGTLSKTAMTRNGKIARLPLAFRQQLNLRLQNGELGRAVLATHFAAKPIDESNLSDWKQGGHLEWEAQGPAQGGAPQGLLPPKPEPN
ncbi:MAG: hypothetical protein ACLQVY_12755 [Limisphaerales bacterium]